jgi:hypothetical protein
MSNNKRNKRTRTNRRERRLRVYGIEHDHFQAKQIAEVIVLRAAQDEADAQAERLKRRSKPADGGSQ